MQPILILNPYMLRSHELEFLARIGYNRHISINHVENSAELDSRRGYNIAHRRD